MKRFFIPAYGSCGRSWRGQQKEGGLKYAQSGDISSCAMKRIISAILTIVLLLTLCPAALAAHVQRSPQKLEVNGELIDCDKYNIDGSNYFKLRDLACLLNGTGSQFNVGYDANAQAVIVTTGDGYIAVDGDLVIGADRSRSAVISAQTIYIDGEKVANLSAYNIGGNNFFKLRDLGAALGFTVDYDAASDTAIVESIGTAEKSHLLLDTLREVSEQRKTQINTKTDFSAVKQYLIEDSAAKGILTEKEIAALQTERPRQSSVSVEEATADVELYFRALKTGYGAYYYFGGDEAFDGAKEQVLAGLNGKRSISVYDLAALLTDALLFIRDSHFLINNSSIVYGNGRNYKYYYCSGTTLQQDENGYYFRSNGENWYYVSCANPAVSIERSLSSTGELIFAPVQWCPASEAHQKDNLTFSNGTTSKTVSVNWVLSGTYSEYAAQTPEYRLIQQNGTSYVALRRGGRLEGEGLDFSNSPKILKKSNVIIMDIRGLGAGGGGDEPTNHWIMNYTGYQSAGRGRFVQPSKGVFNYRLSPLTPDYGNYAPAGSEHFECIEQQGKFLPNDTPIIVLVDNMCGSMGDEFIRNLSTIENVLIVGSNSAGYEIGGNVHNYYLPNSGLPVSFGLNLWFLNELENIDGIGIAPDIWCNPKTSLDAVFAMLQRYDLSDAATLNAIKNQLK